MQSILDLIKTFSNDYANGVTSVATMGALILSAITLFYVKREYFAKYRPYIIPVVNATSNSSNKDCLNDIWLSILDDLKICRN